MKRLVIACAAVTLLVLASGFLHAQDRQLTIHDLLKNGYQIVGATADLVSAGGTVFLQKNELLFVCSTVSGHQHVRLPAGSIPGIDVEVYSAGTFYCFLAR